METFDLTKEDNRLAAVEKVFTYPRQLLNRKHGPSGYENYESYRDWLRDEFSYRCVFSLVRETWPQTRFHIDHLISQRDRPDLVCDYNNLILLEGRINLIKGKRRVPDPCKVVLGECLFVHMNGNRMGQIEAHDGNQIGERIIRVLRLDSDDATQVRRHLIGILRSVAQTDEDLFRELMGYPKNLPDLGSAKAPGNSRRVGISESAFQLRSVGTLPDWY
jgi:hypothetical protein